ncbi:DNA-directed DNA polymerase gamma mip1 [Phlyctochytrium planicorne]|nr:DNA-directed DNA polymerase gamma mip1 [Phlyctochytrium planicorne]
MIPSSLRNKLFKRQHAASVEQVRIAESVLQKFNLAGKLEAATAPIEFELPNLSSDSGIESHFRVLGLEQAEHYLKLTTSFAQTRIPKMPSAWSKESGWTCYDQDVARRIDFPPENAIVLDVETLSASSPTPIIATAVSATRWYSWVSPHLFEGKGSPKGVFNPGLTDSSLINLGPTDTEKIVVGHNASFDRARVREEYQFERDKRMWVDTMSLHTAVGGLSTQQRQAWLKNRKVINSVDHYDGDIPDEVLDGSKEWMTRSSMKSLKDLALFYLDLNLSKEDRDVFISGSLKDVQDNFQKLMRYCAMDVFVTHGVFAAVLPLFMAKCPHPVSFAGMLEMGKMYLTTSDSWKAFVASAEKKFQDNMDSIEDELLSVADKALEVKSWESDPWLSNLDWTYPSNRAKILKDKPQWYRDLWVPKEKRVKLSLSKRIVPYLLQLEWLGHPLVYTTDFGWTFRVPKAEARSFSDKPLELKDGRPNTEDFVYYRIPHRDGEQNVGNPLSKSFFIALNEGKLTSGNPKAKDILLKSIENSYWLSSRARILSQMVIETSEINKNVSMSGGRSLHAIVPAVVPIGTVTRRAVESTWLTASNAKSNRIGSELKSLIEAPKEYLIVGADVDSEELWICSLIGDAQFGIHGATPLGFMTLQGNKKNRTDLHSVTGDIIGISRDQAKVFNYSRLYGAGQRHTIDLLHKSVPNTPRDELKKRAEKLFLETKGTRRRIGNGKETFWCGGTESYMFNELERIAKSEMPETPVLGCKIPDSLLPSLVNSENVAFFSAIDIDRVLRKEVDMDCITPSHPSAIPRGVALGVQDIVRKVEESRPLSSIYGEELDSVARISRELKHDTNPGDRRNELNLARMEWLRFQMDTSSARTKKGPGVKKK